MKTRTSELVDAFNQLGLSIFRELPRAENAFFSPFSITVVVAALLAGARGTTAQELSELLGVDPDGLSRGIGELLPTLSCRRGTVIEPTQSAERGKWLWVEREKDLFRLLLSTAAFIQDSYPIRQLYLETLQRSFGAEITSVDFRDPPKVARSINEWIREKTHGLIRDLLGAEQLEGGSVVLANTIYFMGEWVTPFEKDLTAPRPFHAPGSIHVEVPTMRNALHLRHVASRNHGFGAVEIPYKRSVSMLVILPEEGRFDDVERSLNAGMLDGLLSDMRGCQVALEMPSFSMDSRYGMVPVLEKLGVHEAFQRSHADFGGITADPAGLFVSEVIHRARVRVDEEGTEATAATAVVMEAVGLVGGPTPVPFIVNRPFLFMIRDQESGAVLFLGRVLRPEV